jgi:proline iminopeptidase
VTRRVRTLWLGITLLTGALAAPSAAEAQRARQGLLSLDDARLFYEVVGEGEPVIVVHGGPGLDHSYLQPGLDALATRNTLVYYDQRGTGRSIANLDTAAIDFDKFVDDVEALRQALGFERVSVLAHSFGALIGIEYARRYGDNLRALILMNPVEPGTRYAEQMVQRHAGATTLEDSTELSDLRASEGFAARDAAIISQVYRVRFRSTLKDRERIADLELDLPPSTAKNGPDVARLLGVGLGTVDWWDRLAEIRVPTLVLHGRFDLAPMEMSLALSEALPVGSFEVLDAGHFPYVEDREGLLSAISGFFAGLPRR